MWLHSRQQMRIDTCTFLNTHSIYERVQQLRFHSHGSALSSGAYWCWSRSCEQVWRGRAYSQLSFPSFFTVLELECHPEEEELSIFKLTKLIWANSVDENTSVQHDLSIWSLWIIKTFELDSVTVFLPGLWRQKPHCLRKPCVLWPWLTSRIRFLHVLTGANRSFPEAEAGSKDVSRPFPKCGWLNQNFTLQQAAKRHSTNWTSYTSMCIIILCLCFRSEATKNTAINAGERRDRWMWMSTGATGEIAVSPAGAER